MLKNQRIELEFRATCEYDTGIDMEFVSNQYILISRQELQITIEHVVREIKGIMRMSKPQLVMIDCIPFEVCRIIKPKTYCVFI